MRLERKIERRLEEALGFEVATFVRTDGEVAAIAAHTPFTPAQVAEARSSTSPFWPSPSIAASRPGCSRCRRPSTNSTFTAASSTGCHAGGQGKSTFSNVALERAIGGRSTVRGVATVQRIAAALAPTAPSPGRKG